MAFRSIYIPEFDEMQLGFPLEAELQAFDREAGFELSSGSLSSLNPQASQHCSRGNQQHEQQSCGVRFACFTIPAQALVPASFRHLSFKSCAGSCSNF